MNNRLDEGTTPRSKAETRTLKKDDLLEIVGHRGEHICGVVVSASALLDSFDRTLSVCERILQGTVRIHPLCGLVNWCYLTTDSSWALSEEGVSLHDQGGRCLAVDPTLDGRGSKWWRGMIGCRDYHQLHPGDRAKLHFALERTMGGLPTTVNYRVREEAQYRTKNARFEPHDSYSGRLLRVHHHVTGP